MNELKSVLVATDGSAGGRTAVELVAKMHWAAGTTIEVLDVYEPFLAATEVPAPDLEREMIAQIDTDLAEARRLLASAGPTIETTRRNGRAPTEIVDEAERVGAELIVLGSRGLGPIATMVLGSVAAEVVDRSSCPVLIARTPKLERMVVADDGSAPAALAVKLVSGAVPFKEIPTTVVSVAPVYAVTGYGPIRHEPAPQGYAESVEALRALHGFIARDGANALASGGVPAKPETRLGDPANEIIASAFENGADLVVIGSRGQRGLERLVIGSVARNVLTHAEMSVLIVPPDRRA